MRTGKFEKAERARQPETAENICGVLVHAQPDRAQETAGTIEEIEGTEIHHITESGRFILTVEDTPGFPAKDKLNALHEVPNVMSVALVYHQQCEDPDALVEEANQ